MNIKLKERESLIVSNGEKSVDLLDIGTPAAYECHTVGTEENKIIELGAYEAPVVFVCSFRHTNLVTSPMLMDLDVSYNGGLIDTMDKAHLLQGDVLCIRGISKDLNVIPLKSVCILYAFIDYQDIISFYNDLGELWRFSKDDYLLTRSGENIVTEGSERTDSLRYCALDCQNVKVENGKIKYRGQEFGVSDLLTSTSIGYMMLEDTLLCGFLQLSVDVDGVGIYVYIYQENEIRYLLKPESQESFFDGYDGSLYIPSNSSAIIGQNFDLSELRFKSNHIDYQYLDDDSVFQALEDAGIYFDEVVEIAVTSDTSNLRSIEVLAEI